jgi:hypothetical protein
VKTEDVKSLGELIEKFSGRVAKLPVEYQAILLADLETVI